MQIIPAVPSLSAICTVGGPTARLGFSLRVESEMRDPVRFFTDSQKAERLAAAGYRCEGARCKNRDLRSQPYEFHHSKPHSHMGLTTRYNVQVLCKPCHRLAHAEAMKEQFSESGWESLRQWQRDALERFISTESEKTFVLEAAPGAGKSRFAAFASQYMLNSDNDIDHVIFIAPWVPILRSVKDNFQPLQLEVRDKFHYDKKAGKLQRIPKVDVTLDTYAGFCNPITVDTLYEWKQNQGFNFMLILDEIHHTNTVSGKWGPSVEAIAGMATKLLVMSGTYFRSDNRPISFLEYDGDKPKRDYWIGVTDCVSKRYTRQVSFRFIDPLLEMLSIADVEPKRTPLSKIPHNMGKKQAAAKREVLDPNGIHVEALVSEAWKELQAMRKKWSDAACLVVCRSGSSGEEERAIHAIEGVIKRATGYRPEVVTSDDASSRGRLESFTNGSDPFLCAIRMVSEGVDIPRIRMVLFLSYTDSEMLFRQIVGRCARYITGKEDDTAALVIMPKFRLMADFAKRYESENKAGAMNLAPLKEPPKPGDEEICLECNYSPCQCSCRKCGHRPCRCYIVIDSEVAAGGGQIAASDVKECFIARAEIVRDTSTANQHANIVQLAEALQRNAQLGETPVVSNHNDARHLAWMGVDRKINIIAKHFYGGDSSAAWANEVHGKFNANAAEIRSTWRVSQINELHAHLKNRIIEGVQNV
jgi:superfamily II DNA or RNA helicase